MSNEDRVSIWKGENVLEMDGGDGCTTMKMYSLIENCTLKMPNSMLYQIYNK